MPSTKKERSLKLALNIALFNELFKWIVDTK
jgi:hypothetical protein